MTTKYANTGSLVSGHEGSGSLQSEAINSTLSTQIIIKVENEPVGALQRLSVSQNRPLNRISEIGTDGTIEIVPQSATTYELTAERLVFDQLRLPEAFKRGFRFINAQRLPFDIMIIDMSNLEPNVDIGNNDAKGIVTMLYKNCWFTRYDTPYAADNYLITETSTIWCETAVVSSDAANYDKNSKMGLRSITPHTDDADVEHEVNSGGFARRGSMDASGIVNSIFSS